MAMERTSALGALENTVIDIQSLRNLILLKVGAFKKVAGVNKAVRAPDGVLISLRAPNEPRARAGLAWQESRQAVAWAPL